MGWELRCGDDFCEWSESWACYPTRQQSKASIPQRGSIRLHCRKTNDRTKGSTAAEADSESGSSLPANFAKQTISGQGDAQRKVREKG
jgi:hypothetical protein